MVKTEIFRDGDFCPGISSVKRRTGSTVPSCVSMWSDRSMEPPLRFNDGNTSSGSSSVKKWRSTGSTVPSCASMKSNRSMEPPLRFNHGNPSSGSSSVQCKKTGSAVPSCVSMKSDQSMHPPLRFNDGNKSFDPRYRSIQDKITYNISPELCFYEDPSVYERIQQSCVSIKNHQSMINDGNTYLYSRRNVKDSTKETLLQFLKSSHVPVKSDCSVDHPKCFSGRNTGRRVAIGHPYRRTDTSTVFRPNKALSVLKSNLKKRFECLYEGTAMQRNPTLLNEIYTELYITESESGEISNEHEVRQIETQSRRAVTEDTQIKCRDIFRPLPGQDKPIRTVLTKGVAGIGKTVSVQKFILDWAEGKENQDVQLIFPLPFRELNLMKDKTLSLSDLLHYFFPEIKEMEISSDKYKVLFIFDGLDECRLSLDFQSDVRLCDVSESVSVDVLLTNLIVGNLLPSALIWITSRPAAADLIPSECVHRVTEVRGFNDPQKEEYFRKRVSDQSLAERIISHLKSSRSLFIMCHIPVFCWISAAVLEEMLSRAERGEIPKTLTQMYTHFLTAQINIKDTKYNDNKDTDTEMVFKLGKLAFEQLDRGNLIFYEEDLRECGIDVTEASVYSGLCSQIFREELGLYQGKVFCFVHLSVQEHLAALYVHLFYKNNRSQFFCSVSSELSMFLTHNLSNVHQRAVDEALQSKNGHLDLFLRFLLGLSVESHQVFLQGLMKQTRSSSDSIEETVEYIKMKIRTIDSPEKSINLFHCLNELGDHSLVEEIQQYLKSGTIKGAKLSSSQWSAVAFVLLTSEEELDEFRLNEFVGAENKADHVLQKLLPVIKESSRAELRYCDVTDVGCAALATALRSNPSHLRELDLSGNRLDNSGVMRLSSGLLIPHCKLEILRLKDCGITDEGCAALISIPSHLRELDLSANELGDSGVMRLSSGLNPHCNLETLRLKDCGITDEGCAALASALRSNTSHLRELDLSGNKLGDSGVMCLSFGLLIPHCNLEILRLVDCGLTDCAALASALRSNPEHLRELDLSGNKIGDSGVELLSSGLYNPHCKLEILGLKDCGITGKGCDHLASALRSNPSHLRELNMIGNKLGDSGVMCLSFGLNPDCKLEILRLVDCGVTDEVCAALTSVLKLNLSHLRQLDLSGTKQRYSGCEQLTSLKKRQISRVFGRISPTTPTLTLEGW